MKNFILIGIILSLYIPTVSGQDVPHNRRKVVDLILSQSRIKAGDTYHSNHTYAVAPADDRPAPSFRTLSTIPKYCLAKGAVVCRLEEYVQLHSPFKLNIGVGGE
jgi:hypothetical protein